MFKDARFSEEGGKNTMSGGGLLTEMLFYYH